MRRYSILLIVLQLLSTNLWGQNPTIQDCLGAIPVCQAVYSESVSASGDGNYHNEINSSQSCTDGENNSIWYIFTAQSNGDLGFVITPNNANDDYDWALFDITNATCDDIFNNPNLQVSCNAAGGSGCHGSTGCTGGTSWSNQGAGCGSNPPNQFGGFSPFNDFVPMQTGNTYVLMVSNWTGSNNGYSIDFSSSTGIGIIDDTRPQITETGFPDDCDEDVISILFSEFIQCSSIDVSNFVVTGPGGPYSLSLSSNACDSGGDQERFFNLTVSPPFQSTGDFQLILTTNGVTEVLDLCGNPAFSQQIPFSVNTPIIVNADIGADTSLLCNGDLLTLDATFSAATYLWEDGSTGATLSVNTGGIYSVTVTNECGTATDEIEVFVQNDVPNIEIGTNAMLCPGETILLDATDGVAFYLWQDGSTAPTFEVNTPGTYTVEVTNGCGIVSDEITIDYYLPLAFDLGDDRVLCKGETHTFDVTHPETATYLWEDGSNNPVRTITISGVYAVTVSSLCEVISDETEIIFIEAPDFKLGEDTILCKNQSLDFDFTIAGANYLWQDGSTSPIYQITQTGEYAVTINTACNDIMESISVIAVDSILTELGRDTFLCRFDDIRLDATAGTVAEYEWQDGSTEAIYTVESAGLYSVRVYNICEEVFDQIEVKRCERCDVFVPNAFSPNDDGVNDVLIPFSDCPLEDFRMTVFDRWGGMLFETQDISKGWDGKNGTTKMGNGYYVWFMEFRVLENNRWREARISGGSLLLR